MTSDRKNAFTLIELLVVISIIAVLLSILMPALQKAKTHTKFIICGMRLKNTSTMFATYSADWENLYPPHYNNGPMYVKDTIGGVDMTDILKGYDAEPEAFYCPMDFPYKMDADWLYDGWGGWNTDRPNKEISYSWYINFSPTDGAIEYARGNRKIDRADKGRSSDALAADTCFFDPDMGSHLPGAGEPEHFKFLKEYMLPGVQGYYDTGVRTGHPYKAGGINVLYGDYHIAKTRWDDLVFQMRLTDRNNYIYW